ncbi:MAG: TetR/AcrR family transcriptional regulator [Clostridia bacterium]|nr:TetR/AcrR family transcriptional regulator [Clostridia bacterium]
MRIIKTPEERKAEMVAIASALFARQGFVRTSVSEITEEAQVAKGLFYYYFTTKDDMVRSVVEGYCAYLEADMEKIVSGEGTGREKLARLFSGDAWRTYFTQPLMDDLCLPASKAVYSDMCDQVTAHLLPGLTKVMQQALEEAGKDSALASQLAGTMLYGMLMMMRTNRLTSEGILQMMDLLLS